MRFVHHRKRWLVSIALLALLLAGVLWWQVVEARSWQDIGPIDPAWTETLHVVKVDGKPVFLAIIDGRVTAWSRQDTHLEGCIVDWQIHEERFIDPCLRTTYSHAGGYIRGPSPRSLDRFMVRIVENTVAVDTARIIRGVPLNSPTIWERIQRWFESL